MIEEFYGLSGKPFQLTPDPDFYFRSITHRKALSYLGYGLAQGEGFIVITGEIGAGKSTLVAHMMETLDPDQVSVAQIVTSKLDDNEIIHVVGRAFGLDIDGHDKASALSELEAFLHEEAREGRRALLVVDETQNLALSALEELRMLSNFQLGNYPLLQVLLLGQPEFRTTLQRDINLEQLRQRVIAAHHLEAMEQQELEPYIIHRLQKVGWTNNPSFGDGVFDRIYSASSGIPRKVNQIANRLLLLGAVEERSQIDVALLEQVLAESDGGQTFTGQAPAAPSAAPISEVAAPVIAAQGLMASGGLPEEPKNLTSNFSAQLVEDLLSERDAKIATLEREVAALAAVNAEPIAPQNDAELAEMREEMAELQQAVVELSTKAANTEKPALATEAEQLRAQIATLEARSFEHERTIRQTLTMLIEWIEGEMDGSSKAA